MSGSLRMVTYNVQCRSWAMEAGADMSIPPSETCEERAKLISDNLLNSARDYDVVCLNEVFDEDARDIFATELAARWPYAVTKADFAVMNVAWPGKPSLPINPAAFFLDHTGLGLLASWFALGTPKMEDSGLMLFSRHPFTLKPLTQQILSALNPFAIGELTPLGFPSVGFMPYVSSTGADAWAAKGMLYAEIQRPDGDVFHVFASHTQADSDKVSENKTERAGQFAESAAFIDEVTAGSGTANVFAMGDFNVCGGQQAVALDQFTEEWGALFLTAGSLWSDRLIDVWGREQCVGAAAALPPGALAGLRDPGPTANVVYPPAEQRLDYLFRNAGSAMVAQHVYVDHALATVKPGVDGVSYLSDHRPLGCDLHRRMQDNAPNLAKLADADPDFTDVNKLVPGQVRWYRFDRLGTYEFRVLSNNDVRFEVYLDTDLSLPRQPYRNEVNPDRGTKFVLPSAPFLVKVFCGSRRSEAGYRFFAHRHTGASPWEAIDVVPEVNYHEQFPAGQFLNLDQSLAPGDDTDSKWFVIDTPRVPVNDEIQLTLTVTPQDHADDGAMVSVFADSGAPLLTLETTAGPDSAPMTLQWKAKDNQRFYVTVQRKNTAGNPLSFDLRLNWTVTMLLGGLLGKPHLVCTEETSGWGSDDIALTLSTDGVVLRAISNDEIGDFDDDDVRDLSQWLPAFTVYVNGVEVKVIEEDDISANDVGTRTIGVLPIGALAVGDLAPGVRVERVNPDTSARVIATIDVDDGTYEFRCTLARWHEQA